MIKVISKPNSRTDSRVVYLNDARSSFVTNNIENMDCHEVARLCGVRGKQAELRRVEHVRRIDLWMIDVAMRFKNDDNEKGGVFRWS